MDEITRRRVERLERHLLQMGERIRGLRQTFRLAHCSDERRAWDDLEAMMDACLAENWWLGQRLERAEAELRHEIDARIDAECRRREEAGELLTLERQKIRLDPVRNFTSLQKRELYLRSNGECEICAEDLESDWQADHKVAHSRGGLTTVENGLALCRSCNSRKSDRRLTVGE